MEISIGFRLPKNESRVYYHALLQRFADCFDKTEISCVQYGKQDIRGTESITLVDHRSCVPKQIFFPNKYAMIGYIEGFLEARDKTGHGHLSRFLERIDLSHKQF